MCLEVRLLKMGPKHWPVLKVLALLIVKALALWPINPMCYQAKTKTEWMEMYVVREIR